MAQDENYTVIGNLAADLFNNHNDLHDYYTFDFNDSSGMKIKATGKFLDQVYVGAGAINAACKIGKATVNVKVDAETKTLRASCVRVGNPNNSVGAAVTMTDIFAGRTTYYSVGINHMIDQSKMLKIRYRNDGKLKMVYQSDQLSFSAERDTDGANPYKFGVSLNFKA